MKRMFLLVFIFLLLSAITTVHSETSTQEYLIYIRADGSVEPSTVPIERLGNVYTFKGDIFGSIIVEKDNIVIDGAGFTLQGTGASDYRPAIPVFNITQILTESPRTYDERILPASNNTGIYSYSQQLTIMNLKITEFWCAIEFEYSSDNVMINNEITGNTQGVVVYSSSNNTISGNIIKDNKQAITLTAAHNKIYKNNITDNSEYGIKLFWSFNNISENNFTNNGYAVAFTESTQNVFRNNQFQENSRVFSVSGWSFQEYYQDVDSSNRLNEKSIYYLVNQQDLSIPSDAGWVALVNCTNVRIENLNFEANQDLWLISTTNSTVTNNIFSHNSVGMYLYKASSNNVTENAITDSEIGIQLQDSSYNQIKCNNLTNNNIAIALGDSSKNLIAQNYVTKNNQGLKMASCTENTISGNNFTENVRGICFAYTSSVLNSSDPYHSTFVYGCSNNIVSENSLINNDCGVLLSSALDNMFWGNNFVNNTNQIEFDDFVEIFFVATPNQTILEFPSINFWDDCGKGNYWSNYTGNDSNDDGIGDTAHVIDENNQDNYPVMESITHESSENKTTTPSNQILIITVLVVASVVVFGILLVYRRKNGSH